MPLRGFSDTTYADPSGRMCQYGPGHMDMEFVDGRLYINDGGNNAIRYVSIN